MPKQKVAEQKKTKTKTIPISQPKGASFPQLHSTDELNAVIEKMGVTGREVLTELIQLDEDIALLLAQKQEKLSKLQEEIGTSFHAAYTYAKQHRSELTKNKQVKTIKLFAGECGWRTGKEIVTLTLDEQTVIKHLEQQNLFQFIRTEKTVHKEAIMANEETKKKATTIAGITITSGKEKFFIKPRATAKEIAFNFVKK